MVRVVFIDGTEEIFESKNGEYEYDTSSEVFKIWQRKLGPVMLPREFVKYITMVRGIDIDCKLSMDSADFD